MREQSQRFAGVLDHLRTRDDAVRRPTEKERPPGNRDLRVTGRVLYRTSRRILPNGARWPGPKGLNVTTAKTVLVIEDEENLLEAVRYNLDVDGFAVHVARDGAEGLKTAREVGPDLIVLDLMLPTIDGYEVCRAVRTESDVPF